MKLPLALALSLLFAAPTLAGNFPGDRPPPPPAGPFDEASPHDDAPWLVALVARPHPMALQELSGRVHADPSPEMMSAVARATVAIGERWLEAGELEQAARAELNIYLSSSPHPLRVRAFALYARSGPSADVLRRVGWIEEGRQDAWMWRWAEEWRAQALARQDGC